MKYVVYQCKNEGSFGPQKIKDAVERFLNGEWASQSEQFVLCMREPSQTRIREDAIKEQSEKLRTFGIKLIPWDAIELDLLLRERPKIVNDFFGRAWVSEFCGAEKANGLARRMDAAEVSRLRSRLGSLYTNYFDQLDPGLRNRDPDDSDRLQFRDRFVVPDVIIRSDAIVGVSDTNDHSDEVGDRDPDTRRRSPFEQPPERVQQRSTVGTRGERSPVTSILVTGHQSVLLGGPGSGKSTLLRYLVTDLLLAEPTLVDVAKKWGGYLPIWVPFAFWTQMISDEGPPRSLPEVLQAWLNSQGVPQTWKLVERALEDERLLLLVDGLSSRRAAHHGHARLRAPSDRPRSVNPRATRRPARRPR